MTIIRAKFIGQDGSQGYVAGQEYDLELKHQRLMQIRIECLRPTAIVSVTFYPTMVSFLQNWDNVRVLRPH